MVVFTAVHRATGAGCRSALSPAPSRADPALDLAPAGPPGGLLRFPVLLRLVVVLRSVGGVAAVVRAGLVLPLVVRTWRRVALGGRRVAWLAPGAPDPRPPAPPFWVPSTFTLSLSS